MPEFDPLCLDSQLCFPLYAAAKEVVRRYKPYLEPLGLTYTQYIAMMVLWQERGISVKELGKRLYLDSGTLTPLLKKLECAGFVARERADEDERCMVLKVTSAGQQLRERAMAVPAQIGACIDLSPDEAMTLYSLLYKVLGGLEDSQPQK